MSSDLARISFDPARAYRSVVAQQGRVTLEADVNEATRLAIDDLRAETIDIVGPAGTPDDGYAVSVVADASGAQGLQVGAGTMYVGGWRLAQAAPITVAAQPDWLDRDDALEVAVEAGRFPATALLALLATEQAVGAVEDQALLEVALGGPDTAARTRLMQHVVQVPMAATACPTARRALVAGALASNGLALDPRTFELSSDATLQVSFFPPPVQVDPCNPPAAGGYLGADNQLIRVTVCSYDPVSGRGVLAWGWNNASTLFRATLAAAQAPTATLSPPPVDAAHTPQQGQLVEVLRSSCVLGDPADANFVASAQGVFMTLASGTAVFDPDTCQVVLPDALPSDYQQEPHALFLRLWQAQVPFQSGQSVALDDISGIAVTITMRALPGGQFASATPFWHFAARPDTPQLVYPQRYLQAPQPPSGPRQWLCDLALVSLHKPGVLQDCRRHFRPLIAQEQEACCGLTLGPADVAARGGLQAVIDRQAAADRQGVRHAWLRLLAGSYVLDAPLNLTAVHDAFVLEGCGDGAVLSASTDADASPALAGGLIVVTAATGIRLRRLAFALAGPPPPAPVVIDVRAAAATAAAETPPPDTMCGVRAVDATDLTIADCRFDFGLQPTESAVAAGVFGQGDCTGLTVTGNRFTCAVGGAEAAPVVRFLIGVWMTPAPTRGTVLQRETLRFPLVDHRIDEAEIAGNRFEGMTLAMLFIAQLGAIRCAANRIRACCAGPWFVSSDIGANVALARAAIAAEQQAGTTDTLAALLRVSGTTAVLAAATTYAAQLNAAAVAGASGGDTAASAPVLSGEASDVLASDAAARGLAAYAALAAAAATPPASAPTTGVATPAARAGKRKTVAAKAVAARPLDDAAVVQSTAALDTLARLGLAAEQVGTTLQPALHMIDNDIRLVATGVSDGGTPGASLPGIFLQYIVGASVGSAIVNGNRVQVPTNGSFALIAASAAQTVVTGNLFQQVSSNSRPAWPCAVVLGETPGGMVAVNGNLIHAGFYVLPLRPSTITNVVGAWGFLNTVD